jgi:hypothetical protein
VSRPRSDYELRLLLRFAQAQVGDKAALEAQLQSATVSSESPGFLNLAVPKDAPRIVDQTGYPIQGWYDDEDGGIVTLILHIDGAAKIVSRLERFRPDGEPIIERSPDAAAVNVQAEVLDGSGQAATFDREHGWKRYR